MPQAQTRVPPSSACATNTKGRLPQTVWCGGLNPKAASQAKRAMAEILLGKPKEDVLPEVASNPLRRQTSRLFLPELVAPGCALTPDETVASFWWKPCI